MSSQDALIIAVFAGGAFLWIERARQERERIEILEAQNAALRAAAARRDDEEDIDWATIAIGSIPVVGGIVKALL